MRLKIRNFLRIDNIEIDLSSMKILLYGPNASGKSSFIYALLLALGLEDYLQQMRISRLDELKRNALIELMIDESNRIVINRGVYECYSGSEQLRKGDSASAVAGCIESLRRALGIRSIAHMYGDQLTILNGQAIQLDAWPSYGDIQRPWDLWRYLDPEKYEDFIEGWSDMVNEIADYIPAKVESIKILKDNSYVWTTPDTLSYGYRKAGLIAFATTTSDLILIEGFEAGLHIDLAESIISWLTNNKNKLIVIETHIGYMISYVLKKGWEVLAFREGRAEKVTFRNITKIPLYTEEREIYME